MRTQWLTGALPGEPDPNTRYLIRDPVDVERCREFVTTPTGRVLVQPDGPTVAGYLAADYTLTSTTSWQRLFNWSSNGRVRVETGRYLYQCGYRLGGMSATSGNAGFGFAGSAVLADVLRFVVGSEGSANVARALSGLHSQAVETDVDNVVADTLTASSFLHFGAFTVTTAGTLQPRVKLTTAAAAAVGEGSYFAAWRIGSLESVTVGEWD